ncbi:MAG TPA: LysM peptidoglycan-binding domain-containing protein, partial [Negativicutes bacterium]|nr:LysM peptidoglycan-binding domain-containing protein [Negativicutes bacterium]
VCPEDNLHTVQTGDTLYALSRFYNTSLDDMLDANPDIDPVSLLPGQVIRIPVTAGAISCPPGAIPYTIRKGDTIYLIARNFKMRLSPLLRANPEINPDGLLIGQKICIPAISSNYTSEAYKIRLVYPYRWSKIDDSRYEGIDGFFQVSVLPDNMSMEELCVLEAHNKHKLYGSMPLISEALIAGRKCSIIMPYHDQPHEMRGQSALIARYDSPIEINGAAYVYMLLLADRKHMKEIAESLEFMEQ